MCDSQSSNMLIFPDSWDPLLIFFMSSCEKRPSPFYKLNLEHKNGVMTKCLEKSQIWCTVLERIDRQTEFFVILGLFCPFTLPPSLMIPKICLEILSFYTYMWKINEDHMIHNSWNIRCDRQNFLSFWAIFCPFSPDNLENQNFEIEKKFLEIFSFYTFAP